MHGIAPKDRITAMEPIACDSGIRTGYWLRQLWDRLEYINGNTFYELDTLMRSDI
jgi:hypothetical protein